MKFCISHEHEGMRLDIFLSRSMELGEKSRSMMQTLIREGHVLVNKGSEKTGYRLRVDDTVTVRLPPPAPSTLMPEEIDFKILFEDADLIVLSKPPGVVVHPSAGHLSGTLVHGLLYHCEELAAVKDIDERPGIVHRLDRDTSGAMVVAKNEESHRALVDQFKGRQVEKKYRAILDGVPSTLQGRIDLPLGRHPVHRKKMAVRRDSGRHAITTWRLLKTYGGRYAYVELGLLTGRTHQIRVHMAAMGHPVAGDPVYGKKNKDYEQFMISRQCLHSFLLRFQHPVRGESLVFEAPLWPDMVRTLEMLEREFSEAKEWSKIVNAFDQAASSSVIPMP